MPRLSQSKSFRVPFLALLPASMVLFLVLAGCSRSLAGTSDRGRDEADEATLIVRALGLQLGDSVADVGAGDGDWSVELAEAVGPAGEVWATEVKESLLEEIRERAEDEGYENVLAVRGGQEDVGLPASCCDAILLRMVYHHFEEPDPMRDGLRAALRPGGRLLVIDITPQEDWRQLDAVPDRGGHGIPMNALIEEMTADGWKVAETYSEWDEREDRFAVVFTARPQPATP